MERGRRAEEVGPPKNQIIAVPGEAEEELSFAKRSEGEKTAESQPREDVLVAGIVGGKNNWETAARYARGSLCLFEGY